MAAKQSRVPRFNQNQEMLELWRMLNQPKQEVLTMLEISVEAINEPLEGGHNPLDILKGSHKNQDSFHHARAIMLEPGIIWCDMD